MTSLTLSQRTLQLPRQHPRAFLLLAALAWWALYQSLIPVSEALVAALPVERDSHLGGALQFFASLENRVGRIGGVLAAGRGQGRAQPGVANP